MIRLIFAFTLAVGLAATSVRADEKTYEIKLKDDEKGLRTKVVETTHDNTSFTVEAGDQKMAKAEKKIIKKAYSEEILEHVKGAKKSEKLRREYKTAEETLDGKTKSHVYEGKTVLIEKDKKAEKYVFRVGDEELNEKEAKDLYQEFNKKEDLGIANKDFLPAKAVAINETWKLDNKFVESLEGSSPFKFDKDECKMTGKLTKVFEKNKKVYGAMEFKLTLAVKALKLDGNEIPLKEKSTIKIDMDLEVCIDGTSTEGSEKSSVVFDLNGELPNGTINVIGDVKSEKKVEELPEEKK